MKRTSLLVVVVGLLSGVTATRAMAARPDFKMPFQCGETWTGNNWQGHNPPHSIDWNFAPAEEELGKPVLASAAGQVTESRDVGSGYGNMVVVDHGEGWKTRYAHLIGPGAPVGITVVAGTRLGGVGASGNQPSPHLHYEQIFNGSVVVSVVQGKIWSDFTYDTQTSTNACGGVDPTSFSGLATISRGVGLLDVFATGSDGVVRHRAWVRDHWTGWVSLTAGMSIKVVGDPAAVSARAGRIDLFARGADNHLKRLVWTSTSNWGLWQDVDGYITASPAATTRSDSGVDVFARNNASQIIYRHLDIATNSWSSDWGALSGQSTSSGPAAQASPDGTRMNVFARDDDGTLLSRMWTADNGWYSWVDHEQATMTGRPTASTRAGYSVDVFLRGPDNHLRHWYSPNGADWNASNIADLGGAIFTSPASVSQNNERIDVFTRNNNGDLIQRIWSYNNPPAGWYPWTGLGPIP